MNQKPTPLMSPPPPAQQNGKDHKEKLHRIEDIMYSDADTFPEFSNRDGSRETVDTCWQLVLIRVPEHPNETHIKTINDAITSEMKATWKIPATSFAYVSAPHIPILQLAYGVAKKHFGEKTAIRSSFMFAEPKNDKFLIAKDSDLKHLKYEVILGASRFCWTKVETHAEMSKRIESTLFELMRVLPNLVLFLGPLAFDVLYETLEMQKRKTIAKPGVVIENFNKNNVAIRKEHAVYNDIGLQTTLLHTFLSFHPAWLKTALEAIFNTRIDAQPKHLMKKLSQFFLDLVFSNPTMLKNKKFAQGSGKPIITEAGKEALHKHFLSVSMKLMFLIETAHTHRVIPNLTRIFTKSSHFNCLDDVFSELTKELLTGSSATFKKAFAKVGFIPTYRQSFIENYDYQAKGFSDFSDGLILAKLLETVGEMPHGQILLKLRDPAGDRIRKIGNVKIVLQEMSSLGVPTDNVNAESIVGGKKDEILSILWAIIGVRVAKEQRIKVTRVSEERTPKKRRSAVLDDMSSEVLKMCKIYGRQMEIEVMDLDSLSDGCLLAKLWTTFGTNSTPIQDYDGLSLWEKVVSVAELELCIQRGLDQNMALFVKMFLERLGMIQDLNEKATKIQRMWKAYVQRKNTPKLYFIVQQLLADSSIPRNRSVSPFSNNVTFTVPRTPRNNILTERPSLSQIPSSRQSMDSTFNDATFTVSRDSIESMNKMQKTPLRGTFTRKTIAMVIEEEDDSENNETVVPSTLKKRTVVRMEHNAEVFREQDEDDENQDKDTVAPSAENLDSPPSDIPLETLSSIPSASQSAIFLQDSETGKEMHVPKAEDVGVVVLEASDSPVALEGNNEASYDGQKIENLETFEIKEGKTQEDLPSKSPMDPTQTSGSPLVEFRMTEEQERLEMLFQSLSEDQKNFVKTNNLSVSIEDDANTPELRRILRQTRELKRKQQEIARKLGNIERNALAVRDGGEDSSDSRSDAGHDVAILHGDDSQLFENSMQLDQKSQLQNDETQILENKKKAAVVIQKMIRGFIARRKFQMEISNIRNRMIQYNHILAQEDEQIGIEEMEDKSVEAKLKKCALHGLTNDNLHVVHVAATVIDRVTDLVPSLLEKLVVELNGIKSITDVLIVADRGFSYTSILHPLLNVLEKLFTKIPEEVTNSHILPHLKILSPRLMLLMLKHSEVKELFIPIINTLTSIARRFPDKKQSSFSSSSYSIKQSLKKVKDQECRNKLVRLESICEDML